MGLRRKKSKIFNGSNKPTRNQIFGPSMTGGSVADSQDRELYMRGEGIGSFFSSIFRKILPAATKTIKKIAGSQIVRDSGKHLLDKGLDAATKIAANPISGNKTVGESISDELAGAREEISSALKEANNKRKASNTIPVEKSRKKRKGQKKKIGPKAKRRKVRQSIFDKEDD